MGFFTKLVKSLSPEETKKRSEEGKKRIDAAKAGMMSRGWANQCLDCQSIFAIHDTHCPRCGGSGNPDVSRLTQLIKVYNKGNMNKEFQKEALFLSQFGWRVHNQSYGGLSSGTMAGIGIGHIGLGVSSERNAKEMTVIYERD